MTYPQQPGQQPYGQQPGWQQAPGPGGGYQQHGQFPPGGQYPGGQYPGGQYPGGPQPQKNGKTGLVVGIGVAVVALVVFTVTAFVAPGFLLSDDDSGGTADSGGTGTNASDNAGCGTGGVPDDGGVQDGSAQKVNALVSKIVQGFCDKDEEALSQLICSGSEHVIQPYVDEAEYVEEFALQGAVNDAGPTATATVRSVLVNGSQRVEATMVITLTYEGDDFCWQDFQEA